MVHLMRRYAKHILAVVTVVIIISFVFWGAPGVRSGAARGQRVEGFWGASEEEKSAQKAVDLQFLLKGQQSNLSQAQRDAQAQFRVALLRQVRALGLRVTDEAVGQYGMSIIGLPPAKNEDPQAYEFRMQQHLKEKKEFLASNGITSTDFDQIMRDDLTIHQLQSLIFAASKIPPSAVLQDWDFSSEPIRVIVVRFQVADFLPKVTVKDEEAKSFFEKNPQAFSIPEKRKVRYVNFDFEAAQKEVTVTEAEIKAAFDKNQAVFKDEKGQAKPFDTVKADVEKRLRMQRAAVAIQKNARAMYEEISPKKAETKAIPFVTAAATHHVKVEETDFFALDTAIPNLKAGPNFNAEAFKVREDLKIGTPIMGADGIYLLEWVAQQSQNDKPDFAVVKDKVVATLREAKADAAMQQAGQEAATALRASVAKGEKFETACKTLGLTAVTVPPFALKDPVSSEPDADKIKEFTVSLNPGQMTDYFNTGQGGMITFLAERNPADPTLFQKQRGEYSNTVGNSYRGLAMQEWLRLIDEGQARRTK